MANSSKSPNKNCSDSKSVSKTVTKKNKRSPKEKAIRGVIILFSVLAVLGLAVWGIYNAVLEHYLGKIHIVTEEEGLVFETERITEEKDTQEEILQTQTSETQTEEPDSGIFNEDHLPLICNTKDVTNILLLATDARKTNEAGRSDTMMLVSINKKTEQIVLCSFLRDIWAKYPETPKNPIYKNGGYDKLTHAHAYGGPELTMAVLKETFNIEVEYYVKVNFYSFAHVIDALGGVDLYLTASEVSYINNYINNEDEEEQAVKAGIGISKKDLISPVKNGTYHLSGGLALTHARNRHSAGSDFDRTRRQRDIITAMLKKASSLSLSQMNNALNTVLPMITTNMSKNMLKDMVNDALSYVKYNIESTRIPLNGTYTSQKYNIVPDLEVNCNALYELIYGEASQTSVAGKQK